MSSSDVDLLISVDRGSSETLHAQIERQLRDAIRGGILRPGSKVPSTRDLALTLGISRPLVMDAYAQLAAEGYLALRQGAAPRVADTAPGQHVRVFPPESFITAYYRYDFRPGIPDLSTFPSRRWVKAVEAALKAMTSDDFGYGQRFGVWPLRQALAAWLRDRNAVAVEDDYDAEFRYDRAPVGALQGLAPDNVVYVGTTSKTLAPALRLGWMVVPPDLLPVVEDELMRLDYGRNRIDQYALAHFIRTGEYDRHLRRMRATYRDRREALLAVIRSDLPEVEVRGISAGLHATAHFSRRLNEAAIKERGERRGMGVGFLRRHYIDAAPEESTLLLSYANMPEAKLRTAFRTLVTLLDDQG